MGAILRDGGPLSRKTLGLKTIAAQAALADLIAKNMPKNIYSTRGGMG
jgi:hypothetical protein